MSPEVSDKESDAVGSVVGSIVDAVVKDNETFRDFITDNIRKIAHFLEFGALGIEIAFLMLYNY